MRERPILFSAPMVRAILDYSKTQTRRVVKLPHQNPLGQWKPEEVGGPNGGRLTDGSTLPLQQGIWHTRTGDSLLCPHGQPGDRLWVREAFRFAKSLDALSPVAVADKALDAGYSSPWAPIQFEADGHRSGTWSGFDTPPVVTEPGKLRPGIHMPRWAARITLEVTGVRVERLQDISDADALAEGISGLHEGYGLPDGSFFHSASPRQSYFSLWDDINGNADANPWVWVVEFQRVDGAKGA